MAIDEDITDNIMLLMFVGGDTITGTLVVVLKYLFPNPHCLHKVIKGKLLVKFYFKKGTQRMKYKPHNAPQLWDLCCLNNDLSLSFFSAK
jgi:hypothetical protein